MRLLIAICLAITALLATRPAHAQKPHIVYILADDLGYGDVRCLNPRGGKIATPNLDRLAREGMTFTDAHSGSSVCTPTRYGLLTGRYAWRTRLQSGVLGGYSPPLIDKQRLTVASLLQQNGYYTSCIGKWHLGMDWATRKKLGDGILGDARDADLMGQVDYSRPILNGPTQRGFDYYFGISASLDMPPFLFIENDRVTALPTTTKKWVRSGPAAPEFEAEQVVPALVTRAVRQIADRPADKPLFLYIALTSPHTPVLPTPEFRGKSGLGDYADFVMQTDDAVGQIMAALKAKGIEKETLFIVTSDNGFSPAGDPNEALRKAGHVPAGGFRGLKADIWEGGHRVPFFAKWPGKIRPGSSSRQTICLSDLMATCADVVGQKLPDDAGDDSVSILPALLGRDRAPLHDAVIHHSIDGRFAIRSGRWKLEFANGSGGWSAPREREARGLRLPPIQLYDLSRDPGETRNVATQQPELVQQLAEKLKTVVEQGRSRAGSPRPNDVVVAPGRYLASNLTPPTRSRRPIQVFVLAGQSNMEGQAVADLSGKDYNEGKGTLLSCLDDPRTRQLMSHLRQKDGKWTVRNDVWVRYQREKAPLLAGPLSVGYSIYGAHHFGPELQFGHAIGDQIKDQVLLIKTAWGGKSLYKEFRPPSSGGTVGPYYLKMVEQIRLAIENLPQEFPLYDGRGYELAGLVWYQGWNDGVDPKNAIPEYEQNLSNLIKDLRAELKSPGLPVVIGELTGAWKNAPPEWEALRSAQSAVARRPEFIGNVLFVPTREFVRPAELSPNPSHGHHEFGNAETYFLVGDALGKGMAKLLGVQRSK